jgi:hypothetical protein
MKTGVHLRQYLARFFSEQKNASDKTYKGNQNAHNVRNNYFTKNLP